MDKRLVCPCGLTCCDCLFYKAEIYEAAQRLKELIQGHKLDKFLTMCGNDRSWTAMGEHLGLAEDQVWDGIGKQFAVFQRIPEFMKVFDAIITLQCKTTCQEAGGCSVGGDRHECKALKCINSRGYDGCWQCGEFEGCEKLKFLRTGYGHVIEENLRIVRDQGFEAVKARGDKYYEWQRRTE